MKIVHIATVTAKTDTKPAGFQFEGHSRAHLHDFLNVRAGKKVRVVIEDYTGNISDEKRGYYFGALVPTFAQACGMDYRNTTELEMAHEMLKREFNGMYVPQLRGGMAKVGRTITEMSNVQFGEYIERICDWMGQNGITPPDPEAYKKWRDTGLMDTYHDYKKYEKEVLGVTIPQIFDIERPQ